MEIDLTRLRKPNMNLLSASNMKRYNLILIVFVFSLSSNMQAKSDVYSKNAWDIRLVRSFENKYKNQENFVTFFYSMFEQEGLEVYKSDVSVDNSYTQIEGNPVINYVYLYPNISEIEEGDSYYRLKLTVNKYPFHINDILDLVSREDPPDDTILAISGLICNNFEFEEMVRGDEFEEVEWSTLWVWKLKMELDNLLANNNQSVKVDDIYSIMESHNLFPKDVSDYSTSPWVDSEGKSYLRSLYLYSRNFNTMRKDDKCYRIEIVLDFNDKEVDKDKFWPNSSGNQLLQSFMYKSKNYIAEKVIITIDSKL